MKKSLTIEELKEKIGKPVFVVGKPVGSIYGNKNWRILKSIGVNEFNELNIITFTDNSEISAEEQDKFRFFDGEVAHQELKEILEAEEKLSKKKTGYENARNFEKYFFITSNMKAAIDHSYHCNNSDDAARVACGNHFNDETLTINIARAESLRYQLRRFAALNGGIPSVEDWFDYYKVDDGANWKYFIGYDYENQKMQTSYVLTVKSFGQIYFKSEKSCEKAIEIFKDELLWYFTEFKEMLY